MNFRVIQPVPTDAWDELYAVDREALATQSRAWIRVATQVQAYRNASRLYEFDDGQALLLPLLRRRFAFRDYANLPIEWGFGGALARKPLEPHALGVVLKDLQRTRFARIFIRPNPATAHIWDRAAPERFVQVRDSAHILDLRGGFEEIWSERFTEKTRNQIRKAERSGLEVECDGSGALMPAFFNLYRQSALRWAKQSGRVASLRAALTLARNPLSKFLAMAEALGANCQTWLARRQGQPAAATIVLRSARHAQYIFGAMDKELAGPTNANDLLHRLAIEDACRSGLESYQMGSSGGSKSLSHFKSRFGAAEVAFATYRLERAVKL